MLKRVHSRVHKAYGYDLGASRVVYRVLQLTNLLIDIQYFYVQENVKAKYQLAKFWVYPMIKLNGGLLAICTVVMYKWLLVTYMDTYIVIREYSMLFLLTSHLPLECSLRGVESISDDFI